MTERFGPFDGEEKMPFYCSINAVSKRANSIQKVWRYAHSRKALSHVAVIVPRRENGIVKLRQRMHS